MKIQEIFKHCECNRKHAMYLTKCQFMCIRNWKTTKYWWFFFCFVPSIKDSGRLEKNVRKLEYMSEVFDTPTTKYWTQVFRGQFSDRSSRPQNVKANFRLFFDSCHVFPPKVFKWETDMDMKNTVFENYLEMSHQKWGHKGFARVTKEDLDHFQ